MKSVPQPRTPPSQAGVDAVLLAAVAAILPLLPNVAWGFSAVFLSAAAWRYLARFGWYQPGRWLRWTLTIAAAAAVLTYYGNLLGRDPGVALLVWLTGLKLLELRTQRDAVFAAFLAVLMLLGSYLYDSSLLLGLYTLVVVVLVIAALARLQQPTLAPRNYYRLAAVLLLQALPIMLVAYLMFPRLPNPLWGIPAPSGQAQTGMPEKMRFGDISSLTPSYDVAFRAQFDGAPPQPRNHYWRVYVLWDSDGREWTRGSRILAREQVEPLGETTTYRLVLEPSLERWLPVLDLPVATPRGVFPRGGFIYEQGLPRRERQTLQLTSVTRYRTGEISRIEQARALRLPTSVSDRVRDLAQRWRADRKSDRDVVQAALSYFREQEFFYTLTPPLLLSDDPVDEFLFQSRRGFCEHYAAAFVTLMRTAGIPSRVVVGYQGGVYNPTGNYLIVRQADAHAWAEVWYADGGWTRVDPTAAVAPARIEYGIDGVQRLNAQALPLTELGNDAVQRVLEWGMIEGALWRLQFAWDYANISWYYWVTDYRRDRQNQLLERLGITNWSISVIVVVLLQLLLLYALFQRRARRPRDVVVRLYDTFCRKLGRVGVTRAPHEGPTAFAERARRKRPDLRETVDGITQLYIALRYGKTTEGGDLGKLARAVRDFRPRRTRVLN